WQGGDRTSAQPAAQNDRKQDEPAKSPQPAPDSSAANPPANDNVGLKPDESPPLTELATKPATEGPAAETPQPVAPKAAPIVPTAKPVKPSPMRPLEPDRNRGSPAAVPAFPHPGGKMQDLGVAAN